MKALISITVMIFLSFVMLIFSFMAFVLFSGDSELESETTDGSDFNGGNYILDDVDRFYSPLESGYVTSEYSYRVDPITGETAFHSGMDFSIAGNPPIYAAASGVVTSAGYSSSMGNYVAIQHILKDEEYTTVYMHLLEFPYVSIGQIVNINTQLGKMGSTGRSTGNHLHFEILKGWNAGGGARPIINPQNPRKFLNYPAVGVYWEGRVRD